MKGFLVVCALSLSGLLLTSEVSSGQPQPMTRMVVTYPDGRMEIATIRVTIPNVVMCIRRYTMRTMWCVHEGPVIRLDTQAHIYKTAGLIEMVWNGMEEEI